VSELFSQFSAFTVFLAIAAIGFLFLLVSLVFGELFGHFGDGQFDHDLSHGGPGFFSTRVLSVFVTAFGGFGAVAVHYGLSTPASSGVGFLSGVFFAYLIYTFARFLFGQQASTQVSSADIVGRSARVLVAIPAGGVGRVRCQIGEELIDQTAQTRDGAALAENTIVTVEEVLGETCIVRPK
jgi:membrane protein implicated in regulation of membrane protease activity